MSAACREPSPARDSRRATRSRSTSSSCEAIEELAGGASVMVAAPTGTGKRRGRVRRLPRPRARPAGALHDADQGALEPEVPRLPARVYGDEVGLMTGDVGREPGRPHPGHDDRGPAQHAAAAPRGARTTSTASSSTRCTSWPTRSAARPGRRRSSARPEHVQLVCLSATVSNAGRGRRLDLRGPPADPADHPPASARCRSSTSTTSTAELHPDDRRAPAAPIARPARRRRRDPARRPHPRHGRRPATAAARGPRPSRTPPERRRARCAREGLLPAIYFFFSRRDCERAAERCAVRSAWRAAPRAAARSTP